MWKDPIVEEVRRVREERASRFNFDIKAIIEDARQRQAKSGHRIVSFVSDRRSARDMAEKERREYGKKQI